jgi:diadenosine tetraphosphatase ApaH/serine/threonine PP2A family protein phosphatase
VVHPVPHPLDDIPLANAVHTDQLPPLDQRIKDFETFLEGYLELDFVPQENDITQICNEVKPVLSRESSLLRIQGPTIVVGDIHANIGSFEFAAEMFLKEVNNGKNILFLGNYVDRGMCAPGGPQSVKVIALLFKLKTMFPDKVFLLRGNHECAETNVAYGFYAECCIEYDDKRDIPIEPIDIVSQYRQYRNTNSTGIKIFKMINGAMDNLSFAAVVNNNTFCVHGGITELNNLHQINSIQKPFVSDHGHSNFQGNELALDLIWSDPDYGDGFRANERGGGKVFGRSQVREFLERFNLKRIVRAHQTVVNGYRDVFRNGSIITMFSAPDYAGVRSNSGAIALLDRDSGIEYTYIEYTARIKRLYNLQ